MKPEREQFSDFERTWRAARVLRAFTTEDLCMMAKVERQEAINFCRGLIRAC